MKPTLQELRNASQPRVVAVGWPTVPDAWDAAVNEKLDEFFCVTCGRTWNAKTGEKAWNRCRWCGSLYTAERIIKLPDHRQRHRFVKVVLDGVPVDVPRAVLRPECSRLQTPLNRRLLEIQNANEVHQ